MKNIQIFIVVLLSAFLSAQVYAEPAQNNDKVQKPIKVERKDVPYNSFKDFPVEDFKSAKDRIIISDCDDYRCWDYDDILIETYHAEATSYCCAINFKQNNVMKSLLVDPCLAQSQYEPDVQFAMSRSILCNTLRRASENKRKLNVDASQKEASDVPIIRHINVYSNRDSSKPVGNVQCDGASGSCVSEGKVVRVLNWGENETTGCHVEIDEGQRRVEAFVRKHYNNGDQQRVIELCREFSEMLFIPTMKVVASGVEDGPNKGVLSVTSVERKPLIIPIKKLFIK